MASYTSSPNPAYFDMPTFQAPSQFLFDISRQKQLQFDEGINAVRGKYQSMATLPVSSNFAIAKRDAYMQEASEKLRRVAGADFSLPENTAAANSIYKPLTSDQDILYDLSQSQKASKQQSYMESLKNSKDEKERAQYWDTGAQYVNKSIGDLQRAKTADELHNVQVRDYVPYVDIIGKLNAAAEKMKLDIGYDHLNGGYILTDKNGQRTNLPFYIFAQSQLGPQERDVLRVIGSVDADKSIALETARNGGNETLARRTLATDAMSKEFQGFSSIMDDNRKSISNLKAKRENLIKANGNQITDTIVDQLSQIDDQTEAIEGTNRSIDDNLRDLGFAKSPTGEYIKNENFGKTLSYYTQDLSTPYSRIATKNMLTNWAAGLASANSGLKITPDTNWQKGLELQMKEMEVRGKVAEAYAKEGAEGTKVPKEGKPPTEDYINEPIITGLNSQNMKDVLPSYDSFKTQEKGYQDATFSKGTDLINDADLGLSPKFLTAISEAMQKGASTESIIGKSPFALNNPQYKDDLKKVDDMIDKGDLPNSYIFSDLFKGLLKRAVDTTDSQLKDPPDNPVAREYLKKNALLSKEVQKNFDAYTVFKEDESNIQKKVLAKKDYKDFSGPGGFKSKEQWLKEKTGFGSVDEFDNSPVSASNTVSVGEYYVASDADRQRSFINTLSEAYDKKRAQFDQDFTQFLGTGQAGFLQKIAGTDGRVGYDYPTVEWRLGKNEKPGKSEIGELALKNALSPETLSDQTRILNLDKLGGDIDKVREVLSLLRSNIGGDADEESGVVTSSDVGSDGKSPVTRFFPSEKLLKTLSDKGSPYKNSILEKMGQYGVEIASTIPEIAKYKPSLVSRIIDANNNYKILPELEGEGFSGRIANTTNGRGYRLFLNYKSIDPATGKEVVVKDEPQPAEFPEGRLDELSQGLVNDILNFYFQYKDQKKQLQQGSQPTPAKVYSEKEYQSIRAQTK